MSTTRHSWVPPHAEGLVLAGYDEDDEDPRDQKVDMACTKCGSTYQFRCETGAARMHIAAFARAHRALHSGPFGDKP